MKAVVYSRGIGAGFGSPATLRRPACSLWGRPGDIADCSQRIVVGTMPHAAIAGAPAAPPPAPQQAAQQAVEGGGGGAAGHDRPVQPPVGSFVCAARAGKRDTPPCGVKWRECHLRTEDSIDCVGAEGMSHWQRGQCRERPLSPVCAAPLPRLPAARGQSPFESGGAVAALLCCPAAAACDAWPAAGILCRGAQRARGGGRGEPTSPARMPGSPRGPHGDEAWSERSPAASGCSEARVPKGAFPHRKDRLKRATRFGGPGLGSDQ
eukprot:gene15450-biopygen8374